MIRSADGRVVLVSPEVWRQASRRAREGRKRCGCDALDVRDERTGSECGQCGAPLRIGAVLLDTAAE